jgi:tRNA (guanine26-N2/guanine27-N2)-dimethyltransferase
MKFVEHVEGSTRLLVPPKSLTQDPPPTSPVFFNPAAALNRDISVAVTAGTNGTTFCDSMSGVGARGVRIANEVERIERVTMVDFNAAALEAAKGSAVLNEVVSKCEFSNSETTSYLLARFGSDEKFDYVDLDPFGSPVRQLQGAISSASDGGIVSVTATDTAVLCGVYPRVSFRRYGAPSLKNHFGHETGLRILAGALAREGAKLDIGIEPVFAHSTRHYLRLFLRVSPGAAAAEESIGHLGHLSWCPHCGHTASSGQEERICSACGKKARTAGPLWTGGLADLEVVGRAEVAAERMGRTLAAKLIHSLEGVNEFPPWSFSIDSASSSLRAATAPEPLVRRLLLEKGWRVMRTPFEKTGLKTDAPYREFLLAAEGSMVNGRHP